MLLYRPVRQQLPSPAELFVSFTQEYARRHCLDSLPDDSLTALATTTGQPAGRAGVCVRAHLIHAALLAYQERFLLVKKTGLC